MDLHEAGEPLPQHADGGAVAMFGVHAGAADLHHPAGQVVDHVHVEFVGGVETAGGAGLGVGEDAGAGDHGVAVLIDHQQVMAEGVIAVEFQAVFDLGLAAHFLDEDLMAQALAALDVIRMRGELDLQAGLKGVRGHGADLRIQLDRAC